MINKIYNKEYIVSIDRNESLVQVKIADQLQLLNYQFDNVEDAINFSIGIVQASDFINMAEMMSDIKSKSKVGDGLKKGLKTKATVKTKAKTTRKKTK